MIQKVKIDQLYINTENKAGQPYRTKDGKPFKVLTIKDTEGRYLTMTLWDDKGEAQVAQWAPGTEIKVEVEIKQIGDKTFYNMKIPNKTDMLLTRLEKCEKDIIELQQLIKGNEESNVQNTEVPF